MKFVAKEVPFSSVVGSSITLIAEDGSVAAMLAIMVPNPSYDYKTVAQEVVRQVCAAVNGQ